MRGVSADSQGELIGRVEAAVGEGADAAALGSDLFSVVSLLAAQAGLRRSITDPSTPAEVRVSVLRSLLTGKLAEPAVDIVAGAAGLRWSRPRDLGDTLEHAGVLAQVIAAEQAGQSDELEDELFRFDRLVAGDPGLRDALTSRTAPTAAKQSLVRSLLADKASASTVRIAEQAVTGRHRSFGAAVDYYIKIAADRRDRFVATVRSAKPLSDVERGRLADVLRNQYGRQVHLNLVVDPDVLGGLRVEIGDEVIDGTVSTRIDEARRRLAG